MPPTTQNIFQTLAKKVGVIVVVCLVVLIIAGLYLYNRVVMTDIVANVDVSELDQNHDTDQSNTVAPTNDILTNETAPTIAPTSDTLNFAGLPKVMRNESVSVAVYPNLVSDDSTKQMAVVFTHDETQEPSGFDGMLPILKAEQFICDIASRTCTTSNVLADAYKASGLPGVWFSYPNLGWARWDSTKNILYGYAQGLPFGPSAPIYTYHVDSGTFKKLTRYSRIGEEGDHATLPAGAFSPSLRKIVVVDISMNEPTLVMYENDDTLVESKKYNIAEALDADYQYDSIESVEWASNESQLVLTSTRKVSLLDIASGKVTVLR